MEDWIIINCTQPEPFIVRDADGNCEAFYTKQDAEAYCMEHGINRYKLENVTDLFETDDDGEFDGDDEE